MPPWTTQCVTTKTSGCDAALPTIRLSVREVAYELRRSERARNVRLKVNASVGLVVVVPHDYDARRVPPLLRENAGWICRQLAYFEVVPAWKPEGEPQDGQTLLYEGRPRTLRVTSASDGARWSKVAPSGETICLAVHRRDEGRRRQVLERWFRARARERIETELTALSAGRGPGYGRLYVMDQRTRWGGCSGLGNLSFNWRLVMAPPEVLRYVVAHELAHLREPKHSPRFWLIVRGMAGDVEGPRRWLREHGEELRV